MSSLSNLSKVGLVFYIQFFHYLIFPSPCISYYILKYRFILDRVNLRTYHSVGLPKIYAKNISEVLGDFRTPRNSVVLLCRLSREIRENCPYNIYNRRPPYWFFCRAVHITLNPAQERVPLGGYLCKPPKSISIPLIQFSSPRFFFSSSRISSSSILNASGVTRGP